MELPKPKYGAVPPPASLVGPRTPDPGTPPESLVGPRTPPDPSAPKIFTFGDSIKPPSPDYKPSDNSFDYGPGSPDYGPGSKFFEPESPDYGPGSKFFEPGSPDYGPGSPVTPSFPVDEQNYGVPSIEKDDSGFKQGDRVNYKKDEKPDRVWIIKNIYNNIVTLEVESDYDDLPNEIYEDMARDIITLETDIENIVKV